MGGWGLYAGGLDLGGGMNGLDSVIVGCLFFFDWTEASQRLGWR